MSSLVVRLTISRADVDRTFRNNESSVFWNMLAIDSESLTIPHFRKNEFNHLQSAAEEKPYHARCSSRFPITSFSDAVWSCIP